MSVGHYFTRIWKGRFAYQCNYCSQDSLDKALIEEHIYNAHLKPTSPTVSRPVSVLLYDSTGKAIKQVEETGSPLQGEPDN